jgi:hypothetical protein
MGMDIGNHDRRNFDFTDVAFMATTKPMKLANDIWISESGTCEQYF